MDDEQKRRLGLGGRPDYSDLTGIKSIKQKQEDKRQEVINSDLRRIDEVVDSKDISELIEVHRIIDSKYQSCFDDWGKGTYMYNDEFGFDYGGLEDTSDVDTIVHNLKIMHGKLEALRDGFVESKNAANQAVNVAVNNSNENHNENYMNEQKNTALPESDISEWKSSWRDEYMKWMSAFARTNGGTLNIGVNDDGYVIGLKDYRKLLEDLPNKFRDKLHITPEVRLKRVDTLGTNIRYPDGVPADVASKDVNRYACGTFEPKTDRDKAKLAKWEKENPICKDSDGYYYYIEIEVKHYPDLVTYEGVQYTRSGSTLQKLNGIDLERTVLSIEASKQNTFYVNKVYPIFSISDLRKDLIDRARQMAVAKNPDHEWKNMSDEEMLRSCGLILTDENTGKQGITLAAILLFGTDNLIMSVCYQYKTDAIVRVVDTDRYDDRDVIITNLLDAYDRLMAFGRKHLNDRFVLNETGKGLEGIQSVSARDKILREIVSNILMHRDFNSSYIARMVIEKDRVEITNANRPHGLGNLDINKFEPFQKNPAISKVFREIGLADELGSGMRNSYKYTRLYSGGEPTFTEDGDVFRIVIPLNEAATVSAGPDEVAHRGTNKNQTVVNGIVIKQSKDRVEEIVNFCIEPKTTKEILDHMDLKSRSYFRKNVLLPMVESGLLKFTIPDNPNSPKQKYVKG